MIVKDRVMPVRIQSAQALLRRLPKNHHKRSLIESDLKRWMAGYRGEQGLDYYLSFLPDKEYFIFHDLRLKNSNYVFQIDTLLLTRYMALIIEVKNISGTLFFDQSFRQLIRFQQDKEERFANPLLQAERQCKQLRHWMNHHKIDRDFKIDYLVVNSNPNTILKADQGNNEFHNKFIHVECLPDSIGELDKLYKKVSSSLNFKELHSISNQLVKQQSPYDDNLLKTYEISKTDILCGVHCPECDSLPMKRVHGGWLCTNCNYRNKNAHRSAINDYFLLIKPVISNQECRNFLFIPCPRIAGKLLKNMHFSFRGKTKDRYYFKDSK